MIVIEMMVKERLRSLGYEVSTADEFLVGFSVEKVTNKIKTLCNIREVPTQLMQVATDMACGEVFQVLKQLGKLDDVFKIETLVTSVQTGDTNVSFDTSMTPDARLDVLISHLLSRGDGELKCFRKLKW